MNPVIGCEIAISHETASRPQATTSIRALRGLSSDVLVATCDDCASALVKTGRYERVDDGTLEMDTSIVGNPDEALAAERGLTLLPAVIDDDEDDDFDDEDFDDDDDDDDDDDWDEDWDDDEDEDEEDDDWDDDE